MKMTYEVTGYKDAPEIPKHGFATESDQMHLGCCYCHFIEYILI